MYSPPDVEDSDVAPLELQHIGALFMFLAIGETLGLILFTMELCMNIVK